MNKTTQKTTTTTKKQQKSKPPQVTTTVTTTQPAKTKQQQKKKKNKNKKGNVPKHMYMDPVVINAARAWMLHLSDPFSYPPVSTGASGTPNFMWGSYGFYNDMTFVASATNHVFAVLPGSILTGATQPPFHYWSSTGSAVAWGTPGTGVYSNSTVAANVVGIARPVSCALRITYKFISTVTPPQMYAGAMANSTLPSVAQLGAVPGSLYTSPTNVKGGPTCTSMQSAWVPQDVTDVQGFLVDWTLTCATQTTLPYIASTEMSGSYVVSAEFIAFHEFMPASTSQALYYMAAKQVSYTPTQLWEAYIRLSYDKPVKRVTENPRTRGHKHGSSFGLGDQRSSNVSELVNPAPNMPAQQGGVGDFPHGSSNPTITSIAGAAIVSAASAAVSYFNQNQHNVQNGPHFAAPAALCLAGCGSLSHEPVCNNCLAIVKANVISKNTGSPVGGTFIEIKDDFDSVCEQSCTV